MAKGVGLEKGIFLSSVIVAGGSMRTPFCWLSIILILCCLSLSGCSQGKDSAETKKSQKTVSEEAADAIREYAREPMDKAGATRQLGDERTEAIDEALKQ